jgi:hypothetical protein
MTSRKPSPAGANDNHASEGRKVTFVRPGPVSINLTEGETTHWRQRIREFNSVEILPHVVMRESASFSYLEPCRPEQAETWVVIGRYGSGHIEHCERFAAKAEASAFRDHLVASHPHLAIREGWKKTASTICPTQERTAPPWRVAYYPVSAALNSSRQPSASFFRVFPGEDGRHWVVQTNADLPLQAQEEVALIIADALSKALG